MLHVFRDRPITLTELERFRSPEYRGRTLGQLLEQLRKHSVIDPNFYEKVLEPHLNARNEFVHRLTIGPGKSFRANEGQLNALNMAFSLFYLSAQVMEAVGVALRRWLDAEAPDARAVSEITEAIGTLSPTGPFALLFADAIKPRREIDHFR